MTSRTEDQERLASAMKAWPSLAKHVTESEALVAIASLRASSAAIDPHTIRATVEVIRQRRTPPTGPAYQQAFERRGGKEFRGGSVCWNPADDCDGQTCGDCSPRAREIA